MEKKVNPVSRILKLVTLERKEISEIYFFAILYGLIMLAIPVGIQALVAYAQASFVSTSVILLVILIVGSVFVSGVLQINQMKIIEKIQQKIFVRYAFQFAKKIPVINLPVTDDYYLPELVNRFFDTLTLQKKIAKLLLDFPLAIVQILFGLLLLAFYHPVFIAFGLVLLIVVFGILYFSGRKGLITSIEESTYKYRVVAWLQEMARIIRSVKFARSEYFTLQKADKDITGYLNSRTEHFKVLLLQYKTLVGFKTLITAAMLLMGTYLLIEQQLTVGQFIAAEIVILTILNSVEKIVINLDSVYDVLTAIEKIELLIDKEAEPSGTFELTEPNKGVQVDLNELSFGYPGAGNLLQQISLTANKGDKISITGNEGSGKSSLLKLMAGLYNRYQGGIMYNNVPLANYNLHQLRSHIGFMIGQQDIFEGTLMENITMGLPDPDMQWLHTLCEKTGLNGFIASLHQGFDTPISTSGRKLPATVVKKILLIRALINKPALLLLEEPWQGLENQYQQQVKQLLLHELPHTTVFVITNDHSFIQHCDGILSMQKGTWQYSTPSSEQ